MRYRWLDWQRGLAVLFMIEVHLLDAWLRPDIRGDAVNVLRFIGGLAAPGFLYMAGVGAALRDTSLTERSVPAHQRRRQGVERGLYVLGMAYVFRVVEYVLGGAFLVPGGWLGILRVDILNVIGAGLVFLARVQPESRRIRVLSTALMAASAVVLMPIFATSGQPLAYGYLYAPGGFSLCNWGGFLFAGACVASCRSKLSWLYFALAGGALVALGFSLDALPPVFAVQNFWHTSPAWFCIRLGITVLLSALLAALPQALELRWLTLLGRHSLIIYMVSVELSYGVLSSHVRHALSLMQLVVGIVLMTLAMVGVAVLLDRRGSRARLKVPAP